MNVSTYQIEYDPIIKEFVEIHISKEVSDRALDKARLIRGVESILDSSRYKVGIKIGKCFDPEAVANEVAGALLD